MYIEEYGTGFKTIILVHGGPSLFGYMKSLGEVLASRYKIVDYAQRGTFETPAPVDQVIMENHIADLKGVIDKYRSSSPVILLGHSWGANVALMTAAKYPGVVEKIVALSASPVSGRIAEKFSENIQGILSDEAKLKLEEIHNRFENATSDEEKNQTMEERLAIIGSTYHYDPKTEEKMPKCNWNYTTFMPAIDSIRDLIETGKYSAVLEKIEESVIAFHGENDPIPCHETLRVFKDSIKKVKTIALSKAGHFLWLESTCEKQFLEQLFNELEA
jgi:pimeloyl-ACP methyl ester carboxylesterase